MTKNEYLNSIQSRLQGIPEEEIQKTLAYFSEMIDDRMEDGMSEEEAVAAAGSVEDAVKGVLEEVPLSKMIKERRRSRRKMKTWEIVLLAVGSPVWVPLLICAFAVVLTLYIAIWACVIVFFAADLAILVSGLASFVVGLATLFTGNPVYALYAIGTGLFLSGGGLMLVIPLINLAKATVKLAGWIILRIKTLFLRRKKDPAETAPVYEH